MPLLTPQSPQRISSSSLLYAPSTLRLALAESSTALVRWLMARASFSATIARTPTLSSLASGIEIHMAADEAELI